jgi:hypothetical protein
MEHRIIEVRATRDYRLFLRFEGGEEVIVDLADFVERGSVTEPFRRDPDLFALSVRIGGDGDWLSWPNEVDIDADALWYEAHPEDLVRDFGPEAA